MIMKHEIEKLIWRKEQSLGLGDDDHLSHEQIGELMVEYAKGECDKTTHESSAHVERINAHGVDLSRVWRNKQSKESGFSGHIDVNKDGLSHINIAFNGLLSHERVREYADMFRSAASITCESDK